MISTAHYPLRNQILRFLFSRYLLIIVIFLNLALHLLAAYLTYYLVFVYKVAIESGFWSGPLFDKIGFYPTQVIEVSAEVLIPVLFYYLIRYAARKYPRFQILYLITLLSMYLAILALNYHDFLGDLTLASSFR